MKLKDISSNESNSCLLVIDVQIDFCPGGALAVLNGDQVVQPINKLIGSFSNVIFTQDWHPASAFNIVSQYWHLQQLAWEPLPTQLAQDPDCPRAGASA